MIPDHVTTLGKHVFDGYSILSEITLPSALAARLGDILSKMVMPVIHVADILCVSAKYRPFAAVGFAEDDRDCTDENGRQYITYIKSNAAKLAQAACEHPALLYLMIREKLIAAKDLKKVMAAVEASCKAELVAAMLDYSSNISKNDDTKANVRKDCSHGKNGVQFVPDIETAIQECLIQDKRSAQEVTNLLRQFYGLKPGDLPQLTCADGTWADPMVLTYLLTVHEKATKAQGTVVPAVAYHRPGVCGQAKRILALLDGERLQKAMRELAEQCLEQSRHSKRINLMYPICRYADDALMNELTRRAAKWASPVSGNNAPSLVVFRKAVIYSESQAAMFFADKYHDLGAYAKLRRMDEDTLRDRYLSDIGLDTQGRKTYDLGNQSVNVRLQKDLSFLVEMPDGKTAKSLPKKGADEEAYAAANRDFSQLKKDAKKIVKNRVNILFEDFLTGHARKVRDWQVSYLQNPLLRFMAKLIVWQQGAYTFTLTKDGAVCCDGTPYAISTEDIRVAHPLEMKPEEVAQWWKYFSVSSLKQPFEQIWEPVIDGAQVKPERYNGYLISYYRFRNQEKHGITVNDQDFHNGIEISFRDCKATVIRASRSRQGITYDDVFEVTEFTFDQFTRQVNHIVAYLDRVTIYGRILKDDVSIAAALPQFTLAQIMDFIRTAIENNCTNVAAILLNFRNSNFADFDPMDEFSLDL